MSLLGTMNVGFWLVPFRALFQLDQAETVSKPLLHVDCEQWQKCTAERGPRCFRSRFGGNAVRGRRTHDNDQRLDLDRRLKKERVKTKRRFCKPMRTTNNRRGGCHKQKSQPTTAGKERNQRMEKTARLPCQSRFTAPVGIQARAPACCRLLTTTRSNVGALGDLGSDKEACPVDYKADVATDPEYINETDKEITAQGATAVQVAEDSKEAKINIEGLLRIVFQTLLEECHIPNFTTYTLVADKQLILAQGKPVEFTLYTWKLWRDRHHWASFWKDRTASTYAQRPMGVTTDKVKEEDDAAAPESADKSQSKAISDGATEPPTKQERSQELLGNIMGLLAGIAILFLFVSILKWE
ncbi:predicted protein [Phaeodactylum tricornutum CCAP 1055/1]|uniref:Uncharacterized protein n=3 Tax=Phaeodactylum tricornutum TaxID=2850 RepID=B7GEI6_PHATC|nr:predicted protein [Phaeodactylum tricornutum CCAP 1055/1]EEC43017.1 predicted protein [Phaeodactylum tricornutum CCAP 1055/1]|eukprot:XP_002185530.1 predicted protein [Phaeodactylum tricornutum CCAP 1055/1]